MFLNRVLASQQSFQTQPEVASNCDLSSSVELKTAHRYSSGDCLRQVFLGWLVVWGRIGFLSFGTLCTRPLGLFYFFFAIGNRIKQSDLSSIIDIELSCLRKGNALTACVFFNCGRRGLFPHLVVMTNLIGLLKQTFGSLAIAFLQQLLAFLEQRFPVCQNTFSLAGTFANFVTEIAQFEFVLSRFELLFDRIKVRCVCVLEAL